MGFRARKQLAPKTLGKPGYECRSSWLPSPALCTLSSGPSLSHQRLTWHGMLHLPSLQQCSTLSWACSLCPQVKRAEGCSIWGHHSIGCIKGTLKINKGSNGMFEDFQRSLLFKEPQTTQGRFAHLALSSESKPPFPHGFWSELICGFSCLPGCVCLSPPPLQPYHHLQLHIPI